MIRVVDPTVVCLNLTVRDAGFLKAIVEKATAAASGVAFTAEEKTLWDQFLLRYEEASRRQLFLWKTLGAGDEKP